MFAIQHKVGRYLASKSEVVYCDDLANAVLFEDQSAAYDMIEQLYCFPHVVEVIKVVILDRDKS